MNKRIPVLSLLHYRRIPTYLDIIVRSSNANSVEAKVGEMVAETKADRDGSDEGTGGGNCY
jgi:hypothetical protein